MNNINDFLDKCVQFHDVSYVVEIFPSPLPMEIDDREIESADDLFRSSGILGFNELFIPATDEVKAESDGENLVFSRDEFLQWQLQRFNPQTIYYIINKIEVDFSNIFDWDEEYEKNEDYDPDSWLNEYDNEGFQKGIDFIQRLREEVPEEFYRKLIEAILDEDTGLTSWLETEISEDINEARKYDDWDVHLALIAVGKFYPYLEANYDINLMMDEYRLDRLYVRNYDEGEID